MVVHIQCRHTKRDEIRETSFTQLPYRCIGTYDHFIITYKHERVGIYYVKCNILTSPPFSEMNNLFFKWIITALTLTNEHVNIDVFDQVILLEQIYILIIQ